MSVRHLPRGAGRRRSALVVALLASVVTAVLIIGSPGGNGPTFAATRSSLVVDARFPSASSAGASPSTTTTPTTVPATPTATTQAAAPVTTAPTPVAATPVAPSVASLVAQVEAAGIEPGPTWSWSMGNPTATCGAIAAPGLATGCTSWASGVETTVFSGAPSLALVAHELGNAETEYSALPTLVSQVAAVAGTTSWSPTDAVASCLVVHFLGFQDNAAGPWQCPSALAADVAAHIHDTVTITRTTAICGTTSGITSTLIFTDATGTLSVVTPGSSVPVSAPAGTPVTVSGIGTFVATGQGTVSESGACNA